MTEPIGLASTRAFLLDLDGVVYRGNRTLPGAVEFFTTLRQLDIPFALITNNSTRTSEQFAEKLNRMGIVVEPEDVLTSSGAAAYYLTVNAEPGSRVMVVGGEGLTAAVREAGFRVTSTRPEYVVVGLDVKLTYNRLCRAAVAIRNGAHFIASNLDATLPTEDGEIPGAGAIVSALQTASGVTPVLVGKPQPLMLEQAMQRLNCDPAHTASVGDRLETDIVAGHRLGLHTVLVLTGVSCLEQVGAAQVKPDLVCANLEELRDHVLAASRNRARQAARGPMLGE